MLVEVAAEAGLSVFIAVIIVLKCFTIKQVAIWHYYLETTGSLAIKNNQIAIFIEYVEQLAVYSPIYCDGGPHHCGPEAGRTSSCTLLQMRDVWELGRQLNIWSICETPVGDNAAFNN